MIATGSAPLLTAGPPAGADRLALAATPGSPRRLSYRPELDGLRAIAVTLVLIGHGTPIGASGSVGVTLFFVLSGFLITALLRTELDRTGHIARAAFYIRRARRLLPALAAFLAVMMLIGAASIGQTLASALYVSNWVAAGGSNLGVLAHTWSLAVEEQFYLLWPLAIVLLPRRALGPVLLAIVVAGATVRLFPIALWVDAFSRFDAIGWGCLLGLAFSEGRLSRPRGWLLGVAIIALGACAFVPDVSVTVRFGNSIAAAASAIVVAGVVTRAPRWLTATPLVALGRVSYGVYLWHLPIFVIATSRVPTGAWPVAVLIGTGLTLIAAATSWRVVERPFERRRAAAPDGISLKTVA